VYPFVFEVLTLTLSLFADCTPLGRGVTLIVTDPDELIDNTELTLTVITVDVEDIVANTGLKKRNVKITTKKDDATK